MPDLKTPSAHPISSGLREIIVLGCIACAVLLCLKSGQELRLVSVVSGLASIAALYLSWRTSIGNPAETKRAMTFWLVGGIAGTVTIFLGEFGLSAQLFFTLSAIVLLISIRFGNMSPVRSSILSSLMFAAIFLGVSSLLGNPASGGFPAVIAMCFAFVFMVTTDIERKLAGISTREIDHDILSHYRDILAWTSVVFFVFGVVSLWPWLGTLYGDGYFWILLLGVLLPLSYFWGKLRQTHHEIATTGLVRFNRLSPIVGIILLIAFAVS